MLLQQKTDICVRPQRGSETVRKHTCRDHPVPTILRRSCVKAHRWKPPSSSLECQRHSPAGRNDKLPGHHGRLGTWTTRGGSRFLCDSQTNEFHPA